jgi:uncharacterized protein
MQPLVLRSAQVSDIPAIMTINEAGRPNVSPLDTTVIEELFTSAPYFVVAELDSVVVGYMIGYTADHAYDGEEFAWFKGKFPQFLYIDQIALAAEARHQGIGGQLYHHATDFALTQNIPSLVCEVNLNPPNPNSLKFHTRIGFHELGILDVSDGRTVSLLQKRIDSGM